LKRKQEGDKDENDGLEKSAFCSDTGDYTTTNQ